MIHAFHFLLMKTFHYTNQQMTAEARQLDLFPGQPKILETLLIQDGRTSKEIGAYCALDKSTMTGLLKKMEKKGLILRKESETDKRSIEVYLTDYGRQQALRVQDVASQINTEALSCLNQKEQEELLFLLNKVENHLEVNYEKLHR
jgi:DNA-binding MarR family transcriptional regulator